MSAWHNAPPEEHRRRRGRVRAGLSAGPDGLTRVRRERLAPRGGSPEEEEEEPGGASDYDRIAEPLLFATRVDEREARTIVYQCDSPPCPLAPADRPRAGPDLTSVPAGTWPTISER